MRWSPPHTKDCRSGVCGSRIACLLLRRSLRLGPGRQGKEITSGRRDARGLTFSVVIPARGYATQGVRTRETELATRSLRLRDDARAASPSSPVVCRIVGAPPLCAPARVLPGRTLLEGECRVGSRASPQLQSTPLFGWRWAAGVPVPVPLNGRDPSGCCWRSAEQPQLTPLPRLLRQPLLQQPQQQPRGDSENRQPMPAGLVQLRQLLRQEPLIAHTSC